MIWKLLSALYNFCWIRFSKFSMSTPICTVECYPSYQGCGHSLVPIAVCSILSKPALVQHSTHDATRKGKILATLPYTSVHLIDPCSRKYWLLGQLAYGAAFASAPDWTASQSRGTSLIRNSLGDLRYECEYEIECKSNVLILVYHITYPSHATSYPPYLTPTWRLRALETSLVWN